MKHTSKHRQNTMGHRRKLVTGLACMSAAATVATGGLTQVASASSNSVITFWEFQTDTPSINAFKASIKSFEASHPGITVKMDIVPWAEQAQKLTTALATGTEPDVSMMGNDIVAQYVAEHQLLPLDLTNTKNVSAGDRLYYHLNGKWWAVPLIDETRAVMYNKALFKTAGISAPPSTWSQMLADAKTIKAKTGKIGWLAPMAKNDYDTVQIFMSVYLGYGARYLKGPAGGSKWPQTSCGFNTTKFKTALNLYASDFKSGLDYPDATVEQMSQMLPAEYDTGKAGMVIGNPSDYFELKSTNPKVFAQTGVAPIPAGPAGRFGFLGGWPLVVWKSAANQGVAKQAEEFAQYVGTSGGGDVALGKATGLIPANVQAAKQAPWNSGGLGVFAKQIASDAFPYQYPHSEIPQMGALETDTVQTAVQSVALGTDSVQQATTTLCNSVNTSLGK